MIYFVSAIHVLLCVFMIFVILLQPGKDAGMGAALGGGAATSAFGGRGAVTFLGKVTAVCAMAYFITSLGLSFVGLKGSVTDKIADEPVKTSAPAPGATDVNKGEAAKPADPGVPGTGTGDKPAETVAKPAEGEAPKPAEAAPEAKPSGDAPPAVPEEKKP